MILVYQESNSENYFPLQRTSLHFSSTRSCNWTVLLAISIPLHSSPLACKKSLWLSFMILGPTFGAQTSHHRKPTNLFWVIILLLMPLNGYGSPFASPNIKYFLLPLKDRLSTRKIMIRNRRTCTWIAIIVCYVWSLDNVEVTLEHLFLKCNFCQQLLQFDQCVIPCRSTAALLRPWWFSENSCTHTSSWM